MNGIMLTVGTLEQACTEVEFKLYQRLNGQSINVTFFFTKKVEDINTKIVHSVDPF